MFLLKSVADISRIQVRKLAASVNVLDEFHFKLLSCMNGKSQEDFRVTSPVIWFTYTSYNKCFLVHVLAISTETQYKKRNEMGLMH